MDILTILTLPIHKHGIFPLICVFSFLHKCLVVFNGEIFPSLIKFIPKCFIVFDAIVNGIVLFISISDNLYWSIERLLIFIC